MSYTGIETKTIDSIAPDLPWREIQLRFRQRIISRYALFRERASGLYNTYFDLYNLTTAHSIPYGIWTYIHTGTNTVHYTFPGLPGGVLPREATKRIQVA